MFSVSDEGSGEMTGGGTRIGSGVAGAEETLPRDQTSILGVWNSGEYLGEAGTSGRSGEPMAKMGGLQQLAQWHNWSCIWLRQILSTAASASNS